MENTLKLTRVKCKELKESAMTLADIYKIMFSYGDEKIIAEYTERGKIVSVSYKKADEMIEKIAGAIQSEIGATHKFVGLACENSVNWIVLFWAIIRSGNKPYLINLRHPLSLSVSILDTLGTDTVIANDCHSDFGRRTITFQELEKINSPCRDDFENEIAISTSATTLKAKICIYTGYELSNQILNTKTILEDNSLVRKHYKGRLKLLAFVPFYHIFGLVAVFLWFCFFGRTIVFLRDYSSDTILRTIKKHEVTHIFAVPLFWHTIEKNVNDNIRRQDEKTQAKFYRALDISEKLQRVFPRLGCRIAKKMLSDVTERLFGKSVIFCISGGSYLKDSTLELINKLGYPLHNGYGMSEVGITSVELRENIRYRVRNSIGLPFSSVQYKLEDSHLFIKGDSICHKIIINGSEQKMSEWFDSGDICEIGSDGRYYIKGRIGDIVIGDDGENINPDVIEKQFDPRGALNFCVLGDESKKALRMVVQVPKNFISIQYESLIRSLIKVNDTLPISSRIKSFYFTFDPLMSESAIKVSRDYLASHIKSGEIKLIGEKEIFDIINKEKANANASENENNNGESELYIIIRDLFAECLSKNPSEIGADDHFITDLGGTSLDYFNLISLINGRFSINMHLDYEHACYTVRAFEKTVKELIS